jgi:hypothetical protein
VLGIAALIRDSLLPSVVLPGAVGMVDPERRRDMARLLLAVGHVLALECILEARGWRRRARRLPSICCRRSRA